MLKVETTLPNWPPGFTANWAAETLTAWARAYAPWYTLHPLPPLYSGRIVYRLPANHGSGVETFANPWQIARRGWGDCDGVTTYRLVELLVAGKQARAVPRTRAQWSGPNVHVLVRVRPGDDDGAFEDPSLRLLELEAKQRKLL